MGQAGKFFRQYQNKGYFARVMIQVAPEGEANTAAFSESCLSDHYADWKQGAAVGAHHALRVAEHSGYRVTVERIVGQEVETNPTIVGTAADLYKKAPARMGKRPGRGRVVFRDRATAPCRRRT